MDPSIWNVLPNEKNAGTAVALVLDQPGKGEGPILLSRMFSLALAVGGMLLATPASAVSTVYYLGLGSTMATVNAGGPHSVALTGSVTLNDDGVGGVTLTDVSLSHVAYQVGLPPFIDIQITRPSITLDAGPVAGSGSTTTTVTFGSTDFDQTGAAGNCISGFVTCASNGLPEGPFPLPNPITGVPLGTWTFTPTGSNLTAVFQYGPTVSGSTDTITLIAEIPEPGTALLMAAGLVGMALRRRAAR